MCYRATVLGCGLLFLWNVQAQLPLDCNGRMFRVIEEYGGTTFQEITIDHEQSKASFTDLNFYPQKQINGVCYRPADHSIYGVLIGGKYKLCRIGSDFSLVTLAYLPLPEEMTFVAGDISPDGRYLVLLGFGPDEDGNLLARVDLEDPEYPTQLFPLATTSGRSGIACADIAFHPTTGILYGFNSSEHKLITIDPEAQLIDNLSYPATQAITGVVPSLFFDDRGNLLGVGAKSHTQSNRVFFQISTETGEVEEWNLLGVENNQDACACPYRIELRNEISYRRLFPCTEVSFTLTIINHSGQPLEGIGLRDTLPEGLEILEVDGPLFDGVLRSGPGTSVLAIDHMHIPVGEFEIKLKVWVDEFSVTGSFLSQAYLFGEDNFYEWPVLSDDPVTTIIGDPTRFAIQSLRVDFGEEPQALCPGDSLRLDPKVGAGATFLWSTGAEEPQLRVSEPGWYSLTVTTDCEEASGSIEVVESQITLDLGPDLYFFEGDRHQFDPTIVSDSPIGYYYWTESDGSNTLDCLTCTNPEVSPRKPTWYQLEVRNVHGCVARDELLISLDSVRAYIPNAFSPNGDRINDRFYVQGKRDFPVRSFRVFDRWGNLIFEKLNIRANEEAAGWDGLFRGRLQNTGVYLWQAEIVKAGKIEYLAGDVTLMR